MSNGVNISNSTLTSNKHTYSSNGTTSVIRKRLNFTDEALWKQFSSRRLQLVESLSLSSKKASEQDEEIKICAKTLLNEFNFPASTLAEFDKLVRLAIQSVRRNKKRSEKRLASKLETLTSDDEQLLQWKKTKTDSGDDINFQGDNVINHNLHHSTNTCTTNSNVNHENTNLNFLTNILLDDDAGNNAVHDENNNINSGNTVNQALASIPSTGLADYSMISSSQSASKNYETSRYNDKTDGHDSRVAINSLVGPIIPDADKLPSLKKLDENPEFAKASAKILHAIKNSKSCFEFSRNSGTEYSRSQNYDLLEEFGSSCITSSVLYTLEKWFDHLLPDSSSYIKLRLKSDLTLGLIVKNLDKNSVEVNRLSNYVAAQLFKKLIGGCVKDFGFDSTLNPLCDIFHSIILKDYPIISKDQIRLTNKMPSTGISTNKNTSTNTDQNTNANASMSMDIDSNTTQLLDDTKLNYFKDSPIIDSTIVQSNIHPLNVQLSPLENSNAHFNNSVNGLNNIPSGSSLLNLSSLDSNIKGKDQRTERHSEMPDFPLSTAHIPIPPATLSPHNEYGGINSQLNLHVLHSPPVLRSKQYTHVTIKFKEKELKFRYCIDSNAPPTILELVSNCKQAFGIVNSSRILNLKNLGSNRIIKSDHELERILRLAAMLSNDGNGEVGLELVFANATQGYLNLNHEPSNSKSTGELSTRINSNSPSSLQSQQQTQNPIHTQNNTATQNQINTANTNVPTPGDSLLGRYLPLPRPARPDAPPMGGFMKFQPLL